MAFGRLLSAKYHEKVSVDPASVDQKMEEIKSEINGKLAKIKADPRMQSVTVFSILEVNFPVEGNDPQLMQSRAIEAGQYAQRFKSCDNPRGPASGIFNVQIGKKLDADSRKLPPALRKLFESKGPGHAYGPMRGPTGVQVIAFCNRRSITPTMPKAEMPTRQQVENVVLNEKYGAVEQKYVALMRKNAIIEYKDQSYVQ
jgi:peptidyl-prolyl cis-trans isomerase SurA